MVVLVLGASSTGTVLAAQSSVPGDVLYPVKRTAERVELTFTFTESREVSFHTKLMERRMDELAVVAAGDRQRFVPGLVDQIERHSERAGQIAIRPVRVLVDALPEIEDPPEHPNGEGSTAVPQREVSVRPILSLHEKLERLESQAVDLEFAARDQRGRQDMKRLQEALKRVESQLGELLDRADRIHRAPTAPGSAIPTPTPAISLDVNDGRGDGQVTIEARVLDVRVRQSDGGARVELAVVVGDRSRRVLVLERGGASILRPNGTDGKLQDIRVGGVVLLTVDENGELLHVTARPGGGPPSRPTR
jgi:exonuclease VII small subunit